jgi:hypothetical protein
MKNINNLKCAINLLHVRKKLNERKRIKSEESDEQS